VNDISLKTKEYNKSIVYGDIVFNSVRLILEFLLIVLHV